MLYQVIICIQHFSQIGWHWHDFPCFMDVEIKTHKIKKAAWQVHAVRSVSKAIQFSLVQLLSHVQLFATPWTAARQAFLSHHQLPELAQTCVHRVSDAIQPSHPLSSPSLPALNLSQHQGLFQWVISPHQVAKVLELQLQHQSFQWLFRTDFRSPCLLLKNEVVYGHTTLNTPDLVWSQKLSRVRPG